MWACLGFSSGTMGRVALHDSLIPLLGGGADQEQLVHIHSIPARQAETVPWPDWVHPDLRSAYERLGVHSPWRHQAEAAESARAGRHTIISTGTASGKSLAYQLPVLDEIHRTTLDDRISLEPTGSVALYLAPTKALAADQLAALKIGRASCRERVF